jgi:multidrug resistance efflux pump
MSTAFSRTMRSLAADDGRASHGGIAGAVALLSLWGAWLTFARVPVFERSTAARVEVASAVYPVESVEGGRVAVNRMRLGALVRAGDALVELDVRTEELQQAEAQARLDAIAPQRAAMRAQLDADTRGLAESLAEARASLDVARARARESAAIAANARVEYERAERLRALGHGAAAEAERAHANAESTAAAASAVGLELRRLELDGRARESARQAEIARLRGEVARLDGEGATLRASIDRIVLLTARRVLRAPIDGALGAVVELRPGSVVAEGQRLATVVPRGDLRIVGEFAPTAALGRIHAGQSARARLDGFPWAQWGTVGAVVRTVGSETRDGAVRVEFAIPHPEGSRIPLEHGLPGSVEVEVERVSPAVLVLRAAGQLVSPRPARSRAQAPAGSTP